jgi:hypothetical protein
LDLLLLVHGWKRYEWKPMAGLQTFHLQHPMEKGLLIIGQALGDAQKVHLTMGDGNQIMDGIAPVGSSNQFSIYADDFEGSWILTMIAPGLKDAYKNIRLDRWFSPRPRTYFADEIRTDGLELQYSQEQDSIEIEDGAIIRRYETDIDSIGTLYEITDIEIPGGERGKDIIYNVARDVEEWIDKGRRYYPGIVHEYLLEKNNGYFCKDEKAASDPSPSMDNNLDYGCRPLFGNYGIRGASVHKNILEVEKIAILPWDKKTKVEEYSLKTTVSISAQVYPLRNYRLVIKEVPFVRQVLFDGYSQVRECSSGMYMPDFREHYRTLYWNPALSSDDQGKASIEFYNTQFGRNIEIDACGITNKGDLVYEKHL